MKRALKEFYLFYKYIPPVRIATNTVAVIYAGMIAGLLLSK